MAVMIVQPLGAILATAAGRHAVGPRAGQYGATHPRWFGMPAAALTQVFVSLSAFPTQDVDLLA
jgi:hypothetical protein